MKDKESKNNDDSISLNKYISNTGICSRREADTLIEENRVTINGFETQKGNRVYAGDKVRIDGKLLKKKPKSIYIALNKPAGIVCTTDKREPNNIIDFMNQKERLFPIGRLDKASQGLIFLTNDGDIVNKILRVGNKHEKEYVVMVNKPITDQFIKSMAKGVPILGTVTKKCKVLRLRENTFKIILNQGLNRQIRRMCEFLGYRVSRLKRVRIMHIKLGDLRVGEWRELTSEEIKKLQTLTADSSK